jgi:hypothetical protein
MLNLLLILFATNSSHANIGIRDSGCYVIQGKLKAVTAKKLELVLNSNSRSELHLNISPKTSIGKIKPGLIETVAYFMRGPVRDRATITISEKQTKNIKATEVSSAKQWAWKNEGVNQKCI